MFKLDTYNTEGGMERDGRPVNGLHTFIRSKSVLSGCSIQFVRYFLTLYQKYFRIIRNNFLKLVFVYLSYVQNLDAGSHSLSHNFNFNRFVALRRDISNILLK